MRTAAVLTFAALLALGVGGCGKSGSSGSEGVQSWAEQEGFADNERAVAGARLFARVGCLSCHTYLGTGNRNLGTPDLTRIGTSGRNETAFASYLAEPSKYGDDVMPSFRSLDGRDRLLLGAFLSASKGPR
jgi:mono/diheme cytochrome c family protein